MRLYIVIGDTENKKIRGENFPFIIRGKIINKKIKKYKR